MRIELKLEEVDRGKIQLGQTIRMRVDAIPDKEFEADAGLDQPDRAAAVPRLWLSNEKTFPARATLKSLDPRLRPGMSASGPISHRERSRMRC